MKVGVNVQVNVNGDLKMGRWNTWEECEKMERESADRDVESSNMQEDRYANKRIRETQSEDDTSDSGTVHTAQGIE